MGIGCGWLDDRPAPVQAPAYTAGAQAAVPTFTTAHATFGAAASDFFAVTSTPRQPIEFPHSTHIDNGLTCTDFCHESVTRGPQAGLPSVNTCMICHTSIGTDKPPIQQIAALYDKGLDLDWQRVYGYTRQAHVRFNHAPHIRAKVECATCHGDIARQTVAQRHVDLDMGFCVSCHREQSAPTECLTCHY